MLQVIHGDCLDVLPTLGERFAACVTDPPYHLTSIVKRFGGENAAPAKYGTDGVFARSSAGFMNKQWDGGDIAFRPETWRAVFDVLLPGGHLAVFGGTRTWHRMACAIEDAGFEIRDTLCWLYGSGFPKSLDVSKAIDKQAGAEREVVGTNEDYLRRKPNGMKTDGANCYGYSQTQHETDARITIPATPEAARWQGWGTALKPAWEPIILARKPLIGTVAANVLAHGTGALNVDACRVAAHGRPLIVSHAESSLNTFGSGLNGSHASGTTDAGRWPANVLHDGSAEVEAAFAAFGTTGKPNGRPNCAGKTYGMGSAIYGDYNPSTYAGGHSDTGTASRFFFSAKASAADRADSRHPTVKPVDLMRWLVRLVTPPGGAVLDPFAGSGTTGEAAMLEGFDATLIERDATHAADIAHRIKRWSGEDAPLFAQAAD